jgi:hypothetical protein
MVIPVNTVTDKKSIRQVFFANVNLLALSMVTMKIFVYLLYSERQKYGINSLKIKQFFFSKKSLDRSILVYKNTCFSTKENSKQSFVFEL